MKRSCATCLWWLRKQGYEAIDKQGECSRTIPGTYPKQPVWPITFASDFCAKWEPRDRSLVRCETCEWCEIEEYDDMTRREFTCRLEPAERSTGPDCWCAHWRLREERGDA